MKIVKSLDFITKAFLRAVTCFFSALKRFFQTLFADFFTSLFTIFWVVFSFGQFQRIQLADNMALYIHDCIIGIFLLAFIAKNFQIFKKALSLTTLSRFWKKYPTETLLVVWVAGGMLLGAMEGRITLKSLLYLTRLLEYGAFIYSIRQVRLAYEPWKGFLAAGTLIGGWGLLQYISLPDVRFLNLYGWDTHYYRLISTLFDPAFTGMILVLTVGLWQRFISELKSASFFEKNSRFFVRLFTGIQVLLIIALAASFSRASYLAFCFLAATQIFLTQQKKQWLCFLLLFLVTIVLLPKPGGEGVNLSRTSTITARAENVQENLITLQNFEWLYGRGLFNNDSQKESFTVHHAQLPDSFPILILNATGIGGIVLCVVLGGRWIRFFWKKDRLWTLLLLATLIHSLFNNTFLQPFVFLMLWGSYVRISSNT